MVTPGLWSLLDLLDVSVGVAQEPWRVPPQSWEGIPGGEFLSLTLVLSLELHEEGNHPWCSCTHTAKPWGALETLGAPEGLEEWGEAGNTSAAHLNPPELAGMKSLPGLNPVMQ